MSTIAIRLPNGKWCGIGRYAQAWRNMLDPINARQSFPGWSHFPTEGRSILADMRRGLQERISRHERTTFHLHLSERRMFTKVRAAAKRGAIRYECKGCGSALDPLRVNPNNPSSRYCDATCRSY